VSLALNRRTPAMFPKSLRQAEHRKGTRQAKQRDRSGEFDVRGRLELISAIGNMPGRSPVGLV
jgi:hypothetical protein